MILLVETRRLRLLVELSRLGSMRAVADRLGYTTSTVSQQLSALARETRSTLVEPDGRRVRLTPAGRRLAEHAQTVLDAVEAAERDLDPAAEPTGTLRVAGFATAIRRSLLPVAGWLASRHPTVDMLIYEHEPAEVFALLAADDVDLGMVYDYDLAPITFDRTTVRTPLWTAAWGVGVPAALEVPVGSDSPDLLARIGGLPWIVNSRNGADETVVRTIGAMADADPRITHRADSLDLVQDMILAGLGVGLLPADQPVRAGVRLLDLRRPALRLRAFAVTRSGRRSWPPLALAVRLLEQQAEGVRGG